MNSTKTPNEKTLASLKREYRAGSWSCSVIENADELDVTFQRYSDDAEDRYVIRDGKAELI